jgi:hypothetical protein
MGCSHIIPTDFASKTIVFTGSMRAKWITGDIVNRLFPRLFGTQFAVSLVQ